ncbi:serine integrase [Streptomyces phage phiScoe3]|nr:serine integrase [Streptomyces phage phiScoe3]
MVDTEALFYYRISLDATGERLGVERQEPPCLELAASKGFTPGKAYVDNDLSATKEGVVRPEFEALLSDLRLHPRPVIVWHTDRLVRVTKDLERVIATGVNVYAVHAGHFDLSTPAGRAVARTLTAWAQYEGEQKALRQREANLQRAQMGKPWWPSRPFGLERDGTLNEAEALGLRKAYADLLAGTPLAQLAHDLNEAGLLTNKGNPWTGMTLRPVLMNARNAAIRVYEGQEVGPANWSAIVPEETWRAAVRLLSQPARRTGGGGKRLNLMTGFAKCGKCGGDVKTEYRGRKGEIGAYTVYACRVKHCLSHRSKWVDEWVRAEVLVRLADKDFAEAWAVDHGADLAQVREEVVSLRERLDAFAEDYAEGLISRAQMVTGSTRVRERLEQAEATMARMAGNSPVTELLTAEDAGQVFDAMPLAKRRAVIDTMIRKVTLLPRGKGRVEAGPEHIDVEFAA